jgi:hypothetical protein
MVAKHSLFQVSIFFGLFCFAFTDFFCRNLPTPIGFADTDRFSGN